MTKMTSSTDLPFSRAQFPLLKSSADAATGSLAYAHGHTAGYTSGLRKAAVDVEHRRIQMEAEHAAVLSDCEARTGRALASLAAAAAALDAAAVPVLAEAQDALAAAALDLAEAILGRELADTDTSARAALARALAETPSAGVRTVRMHPADLTVLAGTITETPGVILTADGSLDRGDAFAEFEAGHLDARIGSALARARAALLEGQA
jgi:flagellar assembly protein FliH